MSGYPIKGFGARNCPWQFAERNISKIGKTYIRVYCFWKTTYKLCLHTDNRFTDEVFTMQLTYQGMPYTYTPQTLETVETDVTCQFLGRTTKLRVVKQPLSRRAHNQLKYRGVNYLA